MKWEIQKINQKSKGNTNRVKENEKKKIVWLNPVMWKVVTCWIYFAKKMRLNVSFFLKDVRNKNLQPLPQQLDLKLIKMIKWNKW